MNEPVNRTSILLKVGVKTTREQEATIFLQDTHATLVDHRRGLVDRMGKTQGIAFFQTNCGDLQSFIDERISEGRENVLVRIIGRDKKNKDFLQFAFTDENKKTHTCTVHVQCLHDRRTVHPSLFLYEPIVATQVVA
ncbi:MAG: hypothetical protein Q7S11_04865 [bacterium]|nr:hypothetical protein [bacterium]